MTDSTVRHPEWFQDCEKCPEFRWIGHVQDGEQPVRFKFAYLYLLTWSSAWYHLHPFTPSFLWPNRKEMDIRIRHRRQSQEPPVDHQEIMVRPEFPVFLHVLWVFLHKGHNMVKKNIHQKKHQKIFRDHLSQHPLLISVDCLLYRSPQPISE